MEKNITVKVKTVFTTYAQIKSLEILHLKRKKSTYKIMFFIPLT